MILSGYVKFRYSEKATKFEKTKNIIFWPSAISSELYLKKPVPEFLLTFSQPGDVNEI